MQIAPENEPVVQELDVPQADVQFLSSVGVDIEVVPGLEWDGAKPDIYEDPNLAKDVMDQTSVDNKETDREV